MKLRSKTAAVVAMMLLWLSGCSVTPDVQNSTVDIEARQQQLEALDEFGFRGSLGIWTDDQNLSARIRWQQSSDELAVQLSGPGGISNMTLSDSASGATLQRGGAIVASGDSADNVLQRGLGLSSPVPLLQLQRWVKGLPGNARSIARDQQGKLSSLRFMDEQGTAWEARFLRYVTVDGISLPALVTATGGPYSLRLVLKEWQLSEQTAVPQATKSNTRLAIPGR